MQQPTEEMMMIMRCMVEQASLAMVREFLAKRRYKKTLETLRTELVVQPEPTTTSAVAKQLGLQKLVAKNTATPQPYATLLEILVEHLIQKMNINGIPTTTSTSATTSDTTTPVVPQLQQQAANINTTVNPSAVKPQTPAIISTNVAGPIAVAPPIPTTITTPKTAISISATPVPQAVNSKAFNPKPTAVLSPSSSSLSSSSASSAPISVSAGSLTAAAFSPASLAAIAKMQRSDGTVNTKAISSTGTPISSSLSSTLSAQSSTSFKSSSAAPRSVKNEELLLEEDVDFEKEQKEFVKTKPSQQHHNTSSTIIQSTYTNNTQNAPYIIQPSSAPSMNYPHTNITIADATSLKNVIFGPISATNKQSFTQAWSAHGLYFNPISPSSITYGLVQRDGGPCGLIAAIQATVMKHLLFGKWRQKTTSTTTSSSSSDVPQHLLTVTQEDQQYALIAALTEIIWRAGGEKEAKMVLPDSRGAVYNPQLATRKTIGAISSYQPDGLTEGLSIYTFISLQSLQQFITSQLMMYACVHGPGLILFLYSLCLTRGLSTIPTDYDYPNSSLIGQHHYCTQEMVNLIATGYAVSNVFDGIKHMDETKLKGLSQRSEIGFLSLFEHYNYIEVGSYYKQPLYPIWVICSESHYTVLFGLDSQCNIAGDTSIKQKFDVYYYDELLKQEAQIRLTIDCTQSGPAPASADLEPPINECIRTKWGKHARINWNGTEPIL